MKHLANFPFTGPNFVGFSELFRDLETISREKISYPPHNVIKIAEDEYQIELAVAGYSLGDLDVDLYNHTLTISGNNTDGDDEEREYLHKGISSKSFVKRIKLAEQVEVSGAKMTNGMLIIDLIRVIPEDQKVRKIPIIDDSDFS